MHHSFLFPLSSLSYPLSSKLQSNSREEAPCKRNILALIQHKNKMKSPIAMRRALSRRFSKPEQDLEQLQFMDFKVLTAQKLASSKLEDHLKILNPESHQKPSNYSECKTTRSTSIASESRRNPFLEAKLSSMRSRSTRHKTERKLFAPPDAMEEEELLDFRTTYRVERSKESSIEDKCLKELEICMKEGRPLLHTAKIF